MKVLIIGSGGFLGGWVKKLIKIQNKYEFIEINGKKDLDITNINDLDLFFQKNKPEAVINCAAFVGGIAYGYKYSATMLSENSKMALNLYDICNKYNIQTLVNPISNCAYPGHLTTYREEDFFNGPPHESVYNYATSKRLCVNLGSSYFTQYGLTSSSVVLSNMYGPEDHFDFERSHALGALIKKICDAKTKDTNSVEIWGTGNPIREWLYVEDGANALLKSLELNNGHHLFNIGIEKGISILDLANTIKTIVNWNGEFQFNTERPDGVLEKKVDGKKGAELLNWTPDFELKKGIKKTVEWYLDKNG